MKTLNIFTANLEGKALRTEKSLTKKAVHASLQDYEAAIDAAFRQVVKSTDRRARNTANAAKGKYQTAVAVVAACYPYQTEAGLLLTKKAIKDADGKTTGRVWAAKKLTAAAARGIVDAALKNFISGVGTPAITIGEIGADVEK